MGGPRRCGASGPLLFLACPTGVPGCCACPWGRAAVRAHGRRPARSPSAPRAFGSARRLEARPGPAAAHGHRCQALQFLRHPPRQWGSSLLCVSHPGPAAAHGHRSRPSNSSGILHTSGVRRYCAYPIQVPPPPTGTAAGPPIPPVSSTPVGFVVTVRIPSRSRRRPPAPQPGPSDLSMLSTPVAVGFYRMRRCLPTCRGSNDATFPFGGGEATT